MAAQRVEHSGSSFAASIADALGHLPGIDAVMLGGSRAYGTHAAETELGPPSETILQDTLSRPRTALINCNNWTPTSVVRYGRHAAKGALGCAAMASPIGIDAIAAGDGALST